MYFLQMNLINWYNILDMQYMKDQNGSNNTFTYSHATMNEVLKELRSIHIRKTTGYVI